MRSDVRWCDETPLPVLLKGATNTYVTEIKKALTEAGYSNLSQNGCLVVCSIAHKCTQLADIIGEVGISKQVASQLIDTLVGNGYLERLSDPADRRRMIVNLTRKGHAASSIVMSAIERVDNSLTQKLDTPHIAQTREVLISLIEIGRGSQLSNRNSVYEKGGSDGSK